MRRIPYPNPSEKVDEAKAKAIEDLLFANIPQAAQSQTPPKVIIAGYPAIGDNSARARELADELESYEAVYQEMQSILELPESQRQAEAEKFLQRHPPEQVLTAYVAADMIRFVRDAAGDWRRTIAFIDALPNHLRALPLAREQRALAASKSGDHQQAIAELKALVKLGGPTPERLGLIGGRYKKQYHESKNAGIPNPRLLQSAIVHYEEGMQLNLNEYYCSCNLPALYRERNDRGDENRALSAATSARLACERAKALGIADEWLRPTLLGLAFAERNPMAAEEIACEVEREHGVGWKLDTTIADLEVHLRQICASMPDDTVGSFERSLGKVKAVRELDR